MNPFDRLIGLHINLTEEAREILTKKNHDYRGGVSEDPYNNFKGSIIFDMHPVMGILLRMQDKIMRVKTFVEKKKLEVKDEAVKDAILDIINYSILAYGIIQEEQRERAAHQTSN